MEKINKRYAYEPGDCPLCGCTETPEHINLVLYDHSHYEAINKLPCCVRCKKVHQRVKIIRLILTGLIVPPAFILLLIYTRKSEMTGVLVMDLFLSLGISGSIAGGFWAIFGGIYRLTYRSKVREWMANTD